MSKKAEDHSDEKLVEKPTSSTEDTTEMKPTSTEDTTEKDNVDDSTSNESQPENSEAASQREPQENGDAKDQWASIDDSEDDEGIEDIGSAEEITATGREGLFLRGKNLEEKGKNGKALKCYLSCIKGLTNVDQFPSLPQCLRKIADLYFEKEEYEKAVQFIQAEKVYYETALIDTSELQKKLEEKTGQAEDEKSLRAEEYEKLAKLCLDKGQPQLALEYQGKATKIRQELFGDGDPRTAESLDLFTVMYGEVGKKQYSESMQKVNSANVDESANEPETADDSKPASILKQRSVSKDGEDKKKVRFEESTKDPAEELHRDEVVSSIFLWLVLILLLIALTCLGSLLYCRAEPNSYMCVAGRGQLYYYYMRIKYNMYYYLPFLQNQAGPLG